MRTFVRRTDKATADVDDVIAAAGQAVIDDIDLARDGDLAGLVRRVADIEREALAALIRRLGALAACAPRSPAERRR